MCEASPFLSPTVESNPNWPFVLEDLCSAIVEGRMWLLETQAHLALRQQLSNVAHIMYHVHLPPAYADVPS
ncbi:unnamed protein product [Allacma fusca]|uniref:Uncharacterized protein n=1 Tax=Allacma fusca TaxID=39272 RepID=A0A8J2Q6S6_9HEXA|nr:unnamed protein product [Allacma fusca]